MKRVFLFPGYGAQYVGMGKEFYDHYRCAQDIFEEASNCLSINFVKLCFASSERELSKPLQAYLSLFVVQTALFRVLLEHDIEPSLVTGWGVGYSSAHYAAGIINVPDGLYLLSKYLKFFNELAQEKSISIVQVDGIERARLDAVLHDNRVAGHVAIAFVCAERSFKVIGFTSAVELVAKTIAAYAHVGAIKSSPLYAPHVLYSNEMVKCMDAYLEKIDCKPPRYPLVHHDGAYFAVGEPMIKKAITRFMYEPIDVPAVISRFAACRSLIQIGPSFLTHERINAYVPHARVHVVEHLKDLKGLL
jgi:[acyl-carrier-protein] S-malonyltransferase